MKKYMYSIILQFKLDIRSKTMVITSYVVPLLFFALMSGIFTSVTPEMKTTLIQSMTVMGVAMGALVGLPPTIIETYGGDVKRAYKANGVPLYLGLISMLISTFVHLMIMTSIIFVAAIVAFDASMPKDLFSYFTAVVLYMITSLSVGCVIGLLVKKESSLTMVSQIVFLPSMMLSGILFSSNMLPKALEVAGQLFPATWGYKIMLDDGLVIGNLIPLIVVFIIANIIIVFTAKKSS